MDKKIKFFVMDVDGTLTDGKIYMSEHGELFKAFNAKDGYAIKNILIPNGIIPVIITGRSSKITVNRCMELGIKELYQNVTDKVKTLETISNDLSSVAYIGDDLNDYECMLKVKNKGGLTACPADASKKIKSISNFISDCNGGNGAVRDFVEWILD